LEQLARKPGKNGLVERNSIAPCPQRRRIEDPDGAGKGLADREAGINAERGRYGRGKSFARDHERRSAKFANHVPLVFNGAGVLEFNRVGISEDFGKGGTRPQGCCAKPPCFPMWQCSICSGS